MTQTLETTAVTAVDRYLAALNEDDPATRRRLLAEAFAPDGGMTDPPLTGQGHDGLAELGDTLHTAYAGHAFRRTSAVDVHHDRFRFAWALHGPDGAVVVTGMDVGVLAPDGRVGQVTGFFGDLALL